MAKSTKTPPPPQNNPDHPDFNLLKVVAQTQKACSALYRDFQLIELIQELQECIEIYNTPPSEWYELIQNAQEVKKTHYTVNRIIQFIVVMETVHRQLDEFAAALAMLEEKEENKHVIKIAS